MKLENYMNNITTRGTILSCHLIILRNTLFKAGVFNRDIPSFPLNLMSSAGVIKHGFHRVSSTNERSEISQNILLTLGTNSYEHSL